MMSHPLTIDPERVLVLAPTVADAELTRTIMGDAGQPCHLCADVGSLAQSLGDGAGAILLTEGVLADRAAGILVQALHFQPPWSEISILMLAGAGPDSSTRAAQAMELFGNVTILERPVRVTTLISALRTAIRARRRQYEMRDQLVKLTETQLILRTQTQQLRDSDRRKDEFLATLAHELRNPLAPIRNALQIIRLARNDGPAIEQACMMMERQIGQMVRLIDDLLDVSRITRGKLDLRKERVELASVIKSALDTARPLIEAAGHELTLSLSPQPIYLDADPVRLAQVFANLLNNAAKYTERGGHIWLTTATEQSEVVVTVRDTGIGIPADSLAAIFDMFTQVDQSLERSQGGLGIGLTLVKQLVEMHGGKVEVRSKGQDKGAEFIARLPIVSVTLAPEPTTNLDQPRPGLPPCRILVADDNRDAAESMSTMLRMMGNEVRSVNDGAQAVEEAAAFRPDMILLDIGMPKLNGYDAARRIRQQLWGKNMVIVALTGWGQDEDKRRASEAGFDQHFTKPVSPADLQRLMAELQGGSSLRHRMTQK